MFVYDLVNNFSYLIRIVNVISIGCWSVFIGSEFLCGCGGCFGGVIGENYVCVVCEKVGGNCFVNVVIVIGYEYYLIFNVK